MFARQTNLHKPCDSCFKSEIANWLSQRAGKMSEEKP